MQLMWIGVAVIRFDLALIGAQYWYKSWLLLNWLIFHGHDTSGQAKFPNGLCRKAIAVTAEAGYFTI